MQLDLDYVDFAIVEFVGQHTGQAFCAPPLSIPSAKWKFESPPALRCPSATWTPVGGSGRWPFTHIAYEPLVVHVGSDCRLGLGKYAGRSPPPAIGLAVRMQVSNFDTCMRTAVKETCRQDSTTHVAFCLTVFRNPMQTHLVCSPVVEVLSLQMHHGGTERTWMPHPTTCGLSLPRPRQCDPSPAHARLSPYCLCTLPPHRTRERMDDDGLTSPWSLPLRGFGTQCHWHGTVTGTGLPMAGCTFSNQYDSRNLSQ